MRIIFLSSLIRKIKTSVLSCFADSVFCNVIATQAGESRTSSVSFEELEWAPRNVCNCPCKRELPQQIGKLLISRHVFIESQLCVQNNTVGDIT